MHEPLERRIRRIARRTAIKEGVCFGLGLSLVPAIAIGQSDPAASRPREGDLLVRDGDDAVTPLTPGDIVSGERQTLAWALEPESQVVRNGSRLNLLLLVRFPLESLSEETRARAAEGVVAYTAICTHTGCEVEEWLPEEQALYCGCHASTFDPRDNANVVDGPAPRKLPALPLAVADGRLVVAGAFTSRVGFDLL